MRKLVLSLFGVSRDGGWPVMRNSRWERCRISLSVAEEQRARLSVTENERASSGKCNKSAMETDRVMTGRARE